MSFRLFLARILRALFRFVLLVGALTAIEVAIERVVWGPSHEEDNALKSSIVLALDSFNPAELGNVYLAMAGIREFDPLDSNAYKACFAIKGSNPWIDPPTKPDNYDTLSGRARFDQDYAEWSKQRDQNASCLKEVTDAFKRVYDKSDKSPFSSVTAVYYTLWLEFSWGTPGTRFIALCQAVVGGYCCFWLMAWTLFRSNGSPRMRWWLYPPVFCAGSVALAVLTAWPFSILAIWLIKAVPAVYAYVSAHIITKASESTGNFIVHMVAGKVVTVDHAHH
jgi:hypothetical protein